MACLAALLFGLGGVAGSGGAVAGESFDRSPDTAAPERFAAELQRALAQWKGESLVPRAATTPLRIGLVFHVLADDRAGPAFLAFTPAEVALAAERGPGSPQNVFPGRVVDVLPLPDRLRVILDIGVVLVAEVTREAAAAFDIAVGRSLWAAVKATAIRVYD